MANNKYPELKCRGYNINDCSRVVINKKHCLCNNCYSRYYYDNIMSESTKEELKAKKRTKYNLTRIKEINKKVRLVRNYSS